MLAFLGPMLTRRDGDLARIRTADGQADVHGLESAASGLMVNHASGTAVWDVIYQLALLGGMVVIPVGCPPCAIRAEQIEQLPAELEDARVVHSGSEILALVQSA